ncbi:MAG TPA: hypothetical protein VM370_03060 [Candidatus Thermoplasmatota archaeon]|nr:hypothetical protein [Candidatus Thermoplasmatota archaeon]
MERGLLVFGVLFVLLPLLLVGAIFVAPATAAFGLTLALVALLGLGFLLGIAFVDLA